MRNNACYSCGFCCTVRPCGWGKWDPVNKQCLFLTSSSKCSKYEEIVREDSDTQYPMFGSGCSSSLFNERREKKIKELYEKTKTASKDS